MSHADSQLLDTFINHIHAMRLHRTGEAGVALKKPLLLLLIISKLEEPTTSNVFRFSELREELENLIRDFGGRSAASGARPEQPFFHLGSEPFWRVVTSKTYPPGATALVSDLMAPTSYASLSDGVFELLEKSPDARSVAMNAILDQWWPDTLHQDIRNALGLNHPEGHHGKRARNPQFVSEVLENFAYSCAFCGFHSLINKRPAGVDAAHIQWHSEDGPDTVQNGIALCKLHHWAFDKGVMGLDGQSRILVARELVVQAGGGLLLQELAGRELATKPRAVLPNDKFIHWHTRWIYLGKTKKR